MNQNRVFNQFLYSASNQAISHSLLQITQPYVTSTSPIVDNSLTSFFYLICPVCPPILLPLYISFRSYLPILVPYIYIIHSSQHHYNPNLYTQPTLIINHSNSLQSTSTHMYNNTNLNGSASALPPKLHNMAANYPSANQMGGQGLYAANNASSFVNYNAQLNNNPAASLQDKNNGLVTNIAQKPNLISLLQKQLQHIPVQTIQYLCRKIYPVQIPSPNAYNSLYKTLLNYFVIQSNKDKNNSYQNVISEVLKISINVDSTLHGKLSIILKNQYVKTKFIEILKKLGTNLVSDVGNTLNPTALSNNPTSGTSAGSINLTTYSKKPVGISTSQNATNPALLQNLTVNTIQSKYTNLLNKQLNQVYKKDKSNDDNAVNSALIAQKYMKQKTQIQNLLKKIQMEKQLTHMNKLLNKKCILCESNLLTSTQSTAVNLDKHIFKCKDCMQMYHKKCMPRDNNCAVCQLKNMNPLQKTKYQLFVGLLKKGTKKHQIQFELTKANTASEQVQQTLNTTSSTNSNTNPSSSKQKQKSSKKPSTFVIPTIQIRSIRLKSLNDPVSNFINLFPDACTIIINNRLIKQFQPLHKQSSLKYRRDQSIKISTNCNIGMNKIVITQRIMKKDIKTDERIQPQNHLVGVYLVQNIQVPKPANKLQQFLTKSGYVVGNSAGSVDKFLENIGCRVSQFSESEKLLRQNLFITNKNQQKSKEKNKGQTKQLQQFGNKNEQALALFQKLPEQQKKQIQLKQIQQIQRQLSAMQQQQQLSCDSLKIPLICSLTLQKMKYPGRTIFCKHFGCFDVYNFILLNSQAKIPKWQCPICKASAYRFQIDCIVNSIIWELNRIVQSKKANTNVSAKQIQQVGQVQFDRDLNIKYINNQGDVLINKKNRFVKDRLKNKDKQGTGKQTEKSRKKNNQQVVETQFVPYWIESIYDLGIQGKNKRSAEQMEQRKRQKEAVKEKEKDKYREKQKDNLSGIQNLERSLQKVRNKDKQRQKQKEKQSQKQVSIQRQKQKQIRQSKQDQNIVVTKYRQVCMQEQKQKQKDSQKQQLHSFQDQQMIDQNINRNVKPTYQPTSINIKNSSVPITEGKITNFSIRIQQFTPKDPHPSKQNLSEQKHNQSLLQQQQGQAYNSQIHNQQPGNQYQDQYEFECEKVVVKGQLQHNNRYHEENLNRDDDLNEDKLNNSMANVDYLSNLNPNVQQQQQKDMHMHSQQRYQKVSVRNRIADGQHQKQDMSESELQIERAIREYEERRRRKQPQAKFKDMSPKISHNNNIDNQTNNKIVNQHNAHADAHIDGRSRQEKNGEQQAIVEAAQRKQKQSERQLKQKQKQRLLEILRNKISNNFNVSANNSSINNSSNNNNNPVDSNNNNNNTNKANNNDEIMTRVKGAMSKKYKQDLLFQGYHQINKPHYLTNQIHEHGNQPTQSHRNQSNDGNNDTNNITANGVGNKPPQPPTIKNIKITAGTGGNISTGSSYPLRNKQKSTRSTTKQLQQKSKSSNGSNKGQFSIPNDADIIELSD